MAESNLHGPRWKEWWFGRFEWWTPWFFSYGRFFSSGLFRAFEPIDSEAEVLDGGVCDGMKYIFLELMQGGPFAVTVNTCIILITSHFFDLSCFHALTEDSDCLRPQGVVCEVRLDPGSLVYVNLFSGVLWSKTFLPKKMSIFRT